VINGRVSDEANAMDVNRRGIYQKNRALRVLCDIYILKL
jgi:hypothetical protein